MTQSVEHYLRIYSIRKDLMNEGITKPNNIGRELINKLVNRLSELDPSLPCHLTHAKDKENNIWYTFTVNNEEIARVNFGPEINQGT